VFCMLIVYEFKLSSFFPFIYFFFICGTRSNSLIFIWMNS